MINVAGTPEYAVALGGETANGTVGSDDDETAPLPHDPRNTVQQTDNSNAAACANGRCIFTGIPFSVLNQHSNNIAKVLATIDDSIKMLSQNHFLS